MNHPERSNLRWRSPLVFLLALRAPCPRNRAGPTKSDLATDAGHSFVCEGEGKTEEDAIATAQAICNDKICKVCGVEVESTTTTNESLKGIDLQRKVIERCRRVRKTETQVKRKSADCEDSGCSAWLEIFYSAEDEKAECPSYTKEDFTDPAACEQDIDAFRNVKDRSADSFRERTRDLDAALIHCAKIDVRPTPAILALDAKLRAGMDAFEFTEGMQNRLVEESSVGDPWERGVDNKRDAAMQDRPYWAWYLTSNPKLRQEIAESKLLAQRLQLVRDYVANRALVFDVIEAVRTRDLDTPAGVEKLRAALEKAPVGSQYDSPDVHISALSAFFHTKSDISALKAQLRRQYDPSKLQPGDAWHAAIFLKSDDRVSEEDWKWLFASESTQLCVECMRVLLEAHDHGSPEARFAQFDQAYAFAVPRLKTKDPEARAFVLLTGQSDAGLFLGALPRVPKTIAPQLEWDFLSAEVNALDNKKASPEEKKALLALVVSLQQGMVDRAAGRDLENECNGLADHLKRLEEKGADASPLGAQACACLTGPMLTRPTPGTATISISGRRSASWDASRPSPKCGLSNCYSTIVIL